MHENKPPLVTNPRDPRYLALRSLQTSPGRSRTNLYLIEGIRHLARAVDEHAPIESVFFDPSVLSNRFGRKLIRRLLQTHVLNGASPERLNRREGVEWVPAMRLSKQLYRDLTLAAEPQGIGAVLRQQYISIERVPHPSRFSKRGILDPTIVAVAPSFPRSLREGGDFDLRSTRTDGKGTSSLVPKIANNDAALAAEGIYLAVESIDSPGNLGTIIRTAEAAGVNAIFLLGSDDDPWHPAAVRASMGSLFSQTLVKCTPQEFTAWARAQGVATVASSPSGLLDYKALRSRGPVALLIGSEKRGLSPHLLEASDFTVRIPMRGRCDSINVAVAAGVLLFEMARPVNTTHSS